jgi:aspartyl-tRNA(Asn)/glutamyl-tRNA(Gln) amidotransferase subunit A
LRGFKPPYESTVSGKLKDAGAGMLGKLNMDEFAMGSSNETSAYGPVISPWQRNDGGNAALPRAEARAAPRQPLPPAWRLA